VIFKLARNSTIYDIQAEAGVIATLIFNPTFYLHNENLKYVHFYNKDSACIYWAISQLLKQGVENIDSFNLTTMINSNDGVKNTFDKFNIDLEKYINLSKNIVRNTLEEYKILVDRIMALAFKRELHKQLTRFDKMCLDLSQDDIGKLSNNIYESLNKLTEEYILGDEDDLKQIGEDIDKIWEEIESDSKQPETVLNPKIPLLRNYFTYSKQEVILLCARYKQGKSAILMNETLYQAQQGHSVLYLDSEMKKKEFIIRGIAHLAQVDVKKIKQGTYSKEEKEKLKEAKELFKTYKIIHKYKPEWREEDIYTTTKIVQNKQGLDFLVFDYIKDNDGDANTLYNKLGKKADFIKNMVAGQLDIPVLSATQLNRNGEISDSDKLARYVSTVVYWRQKTSKELQGKDWRKVGNATMQVRANRLGEQMQEGENLHICFDGNKMTIWEAPEQEKEEEPDI
jgi:replicative DNA helicase